MKPLTTDEVISLATTVLLNANPFDTRYEFTQTELVSFAHKVAAIVELEDPRVRDLAMLLGKAAYTLKRTAPGHPLAIEIARKANDYLRTLRSWRGTSSGLTSGGRCLKANV